MDRMVAETVRLISVLVGSLGLAMKVGCEVFMRLPRGS